MDTNRPDIQPKSWLWPIVLLALGTLLAASSLLASLGVLHAAWIIGPLFGPLGGICLVIGAQLARHIGKVNRLARSGITARATVTSIDTTRRFNLGMPVLRIGMAITVDERSKHHVTVRDSPPHHLVSLLRPGASIPVVVDPGVPEQVLVDWERAERERSGPGL